MAEVRITKEQMRARRWFALLRTRLCGALEAVEAQHQPKNPPRFQMKKWQRPAGGGGVMAILKGEVFEKAGIHISTVHGAMPPQLRQLAGSREVKGGSFWASGISFIAHPRNPHAPAAHMNCRMIGTQTGKKRHFWYGGGADLTPMLNKARQPQHEDASAFLTGFQEICEGHKSGDWKKFSQWCDEYFYLPHRKEKRGIGGIFFDDLATGDADSDFAFVKAVGQGFLEIYPALVEKRRRARFSNAQREEQLQQRGRYAEFNLLYDRGTRFGLTAGGNIEAILSSLPPLVRWV